MTDSSYEALAKRVDELERKMSTTISPPKDWRSAVGMSGDSEFMKQIDEECLRARWPHARRPTKEFFEE